jgi:adenylate cyclase
VIEIELAQGARVRVSGRVDASEMSGEQVIAALRKFHGIVEDAVFGNDGTLDKYIGDGVMATLGTPRPGPHDATNAIICARRLVTAFAPWNWSRAASELQKLSLSVGLHFGQVTLGEVGSGRRFEFTAVGNAVNIANRIEAMSRTLKVAIHASDAVVAAVQRESGDEFLDGFLDLGLQTIRGQKGALRLWGLTTAALAGRG